MAFDARALGAQAMSDNRAYKARTGSPYSSFAPRPPTMPAPQQNLAPAQAQPQQWNGQNMSGPNAKATTSSPQLATLYGQQANGTMALANNGQNMGGPYAKANSPAPGLDAFYNKAQAAFNNNGYNMGGTNALPNSPAPSLDRYFNQAKENMTGSNALPTTSSPQLANLYGQFGQGPGAPPSTPQIAPPSSLPRPAWIDTYLGSDQARDRNLAINWVTQNRTGQAPNFVQPGGRDFWEYQRRNSGRG